MLETQQEEWIWKNLTRMNESVHFRSDGVSATCSVSSGSAVILILVTGTTNTSDVLQNLDS